MEEESEEPESRLRWLPNSLRKPLVTGYLDIHQQRAAGCYVLFCLTSPGFLLLSSNRVMCFNEVLQTPDSGNKFPFKVLGMNLKLSHLSACGIFPRILFVAEHF
ncbi:hypothetical protein XENORESO_003329 [Xenotaenia resolanae]|uniref:Uncharacterized protein n=1 Tax=Xenotaenia resolanae TaxID=208358 RepID=A0ABV0WUU1_9TELE